MPELQLPGHPPVSAMLVGEIGLDQNGALMPEQGPTVIHASLYALPFSILRGSYPPLGQNRLMGWDLHLMTAMSLKDSRWA
jgi:hypothetical protein